MLAGGRREEKKRKRGIGRRRGRGGRGRDEDEDEERSEEKREREKREREESSVLKVWQIVLIIVGIIFIVLGLMSLASAASALLSPRLSARFGMVETMALTHAPANVLLIGAAFAPSPQLAVLCLAGRSLLSQLDVPPRVAFVMSLVQPEERSATAAFTNLPRSIATASTPWLGGWLLTKSSFGWPLVIGGSMKLAYDALLWIRFRKFSTRA